MNSPTTAQTGGQPMAASGGRNSAANTDTALVVNGLTKRFGSFVAVDNLSFSVPRGSIFGFLGPNGAGKTTTLGMLLGLVPIDGGTARILDFDVRSHLAEALQRTGALVERPAFYPYLSGRQNLSILARLAGIHQQDTIDNALQAVDLTERADAKFGGYSTGMKQRLGIAAALIKNPDLIVLDEPTNGLDPAGQREIRRLVHNLAEEGRTVIFSSHLLHEVQETCTHVAIIDHGKLVSTGPLNEILAAQAGVEVRVDRIDEARQFLQNSPEIQGTEVIDGRLLIEVPAGHAASINRMLVQAGFDVSELRPLESRLEDRFLTLTEEFEKGDGHGTA